MGEAAEVAGRIPDLAGTAEGDLRRWGWWLYDLYPADSSGRLGLVQPDLLAEHHAITKLTGDPGLGRAVLSRLNPTQAVWLPKTPSGQVITALPTCSGASVSR